MEEGDGYWMTILQGFAARPLTWSQRRRGCVEGVFCLDYDEEEEAASTTRGERVSGVLGDDDVDDQAETRISIKGAPQPQGFLFVSAERTDLWACSFSLAMEDNHHHI